MKLLRRNRHSGAIPKVVTGRRRGSKTEWIGRLGRVLRVVLLVLLPLLLLVPVYLWSQQLLAQPIARVSINGKFQHLSNEQLVAVIKPHLAVGFVRVDLDAIRTELRNIPWVMDASLTRRWPDQLEVQVSEQLPIARWGKDGYLNHRGEIFRPTHVESVDSLPKLSGPDSRSAEVISHYRALSELLRVQGLSLDRLELDDRYSWQATINNRITMVLGKDQVMEKMQRFLRVYRQSLSEDLNRIEKIDMRYSNGLAVSWLPQPLKG